MANKSATLRVLVVCAVFLLCGDLLQSSAQRRGRHRHRKAVAATEDVADEQETATPTSIEIRVKLKDGTKIVVDDAWESEQGFWYRQGGLTHLLGRDRAVGIERAATQIKAEPQIARVTEINAPQGTSNDGPAWIYLVGGARVEADSASESRLACGTGAAQCQYFSIKAVLITLSGKIRKKLRLLLARRTVVGARAVQGLII